MKTLQDVKQHLIDYLAQIDLNKMEMKDLGGYVYIVERLDAMEKPNPIDALTRGALGMNAPFGYGVCVDSDDGDKEVS